MLGAIASALVARCCAGSQLDPVLTEAFLTAWEAGVLLRTAA